MSHSPLPLDSPHWQLYEGGYRLPYDASAPLRQLIETGPTPELWDELCQELHHQGDVGSASYAAVPWLVEFLRRAPKLDDTALLLIALIELQRPENDPVPLEVAPAYFDAIKSLPLVLGTHVDHSWDDQVMRFASACIALARGRRWFAKAYFDLDHDTAARWFSEEFGWNLDSSH